VTHPDPEERGAERIVILVPGPGLAVAAAQILEAKGLGECVTIVAADDIVGAERLFGNEITVPLVVDDDLRALVHRTELVCAEPFIERERAERDWKQRERQRPRRRKRR
jgi:F420-dependent methylenetetrahydromethanopterin dehydrogenase